MRSLFAVPMVLENGESMKAFSFLRALT